MTRQETVETVKQVIKYSDPEYFDRGISEEDVLKNNFDSLEVVEFGMNLEKALSISIPDSTIEKWKTVKDVVDYIEQLELTKE